MHTDNRVGYNLRRRVASHRILICDLAFDMDNYSQIHLRDKFSLTTYLDRIGRPSVFFLVFLGHRTETLGKATQWWVTIRDLNFAGHLPLKKGLLERMTLTLGEVVYGGRLWIFGRFVYDGRLWLAHLLCVYMYPYVCTPELQVSHGSAWRGFINFRVSLWFSIYSKLNEISPMGEPYQTLSHDSVFRLVGKIMYSVASEPVLAFQLNLIYCKSASLSIWKELAPTLQVNLQWPNPVSEGSLGLFVFSSRYPVTFTRCATWGNSTLQARKAFSFYLNSYIIIYDRISWSLHCTAYVSRMSRAPGRCTSLVRKTRGLRLSLVS